MKKILNSIKNNRLIVAFFILIFILGITIYKDYGLTGDETLQRFHSLTNYNEYTKVIDYLFHTKLSDSIKNLNEYGITSGGISKYPFNKYGVAIQMPLVFIEHLFDFKLPYSSIFLMRHFYTFLIFFFSLIYLYLILKKYILKKKYLSLLGPIFLLLSPRIFGDSFYNIKDLMFLSLSTINIYYAIKFLEKSSTKTIFKLSLITAFNINCRIVGGIIIFFTFLFKIIYNKKKSTKHLISDLIKLFLFTVIIFIMITPASWKNPFLYPFDTIKFFYNYHDPVSNAVQKCLYFGNWIEARHLPWHYLPVWIIVTTPFIYILLILIGIFIFFKNLFMKKIKIDQNLLFINSILVFILIFVIIFKPTMYGGWRHFYFLYPIIIINCCYIFNDLMKSKYKFIFSFLVILNLSFVLVWMIKNHPYQMEYFSFPWKDYAYQNFETNYWQITHTHAVSYILKHDKRKGITIQSYYNTAAHFLLKENRTHLLEENDYFDYIIDGSKYKAITSKEYKEIYCYKIHNIRLYTIYKRINY